MNWVAFISQTGREVYNIYKQTGIKPLFVVTNNINRVIQEVKDEFDIKIIPNRPSVEDYLSLEIPQNSIVTLNGWLRIVPKEIVNKYTIYNGHPGLINRYPELKGLDPQIRAIKGNYEYIGCVIHKVDEFLDNGEILCSIQTKINKSWNEDDYFNKFSQMMLDLWVGFFKDFN